MMLVFTLYIKQKCIKLPNSFLFKQEKYLSLLLPTNITFQYISVSFNVF